MRVQGMRAVGLLGLWVAALAQPTAVLAAEAATCAEGYLLCLNEASQAESGVTWKELGCLRSYGSCLREQAFGS